MWSDLKDWGYGFVLFSLGVFFEKLRASGERTLALKHTETPSKPVNSASDFETEELVELVDEIDTTNVTKAADLGPSVKVRIYQDQAKPSQNKRQITNLPVQKPQIRRLTQKNNLPQADQ